MARRERKGIFLAKPLKDVSIENWTDGYYVQPKLNGERCVAKVTDSDLICLFSSTQLVINSVPHINREFRYIQERTDIKNVVFDGELYVHGLTFEQIHSIVSRKAALHPQYEMMQYHIFDIISTDFNQKDRIELLQALEKHISPYSPIKIVPTLKADTFANAFSYLATFMSAGFEGIIFRHPKAYYEMKKSKYLVKYKPRDEDWFEVIGFTEEETIDGIPKDTLGAFVCEMTSGERFKVGSGSLLTKESRQDFWDRRKELLKRDSYIKVKYQGFTSSRKVPWNPVVIDIKERC